MRLVFLVSATLLLTGCAVHDGRPSVKVFDAAPQGQFKSVSHWAVVANDVARTVGGVEGLKARPVYVPVEEKSQFEKIFRHQLKGELLANGVRLAASPKNAMLLKIEVDSVQHEVVEKYRPGYLTFLATGVQVVRGLDTFRQAFNTVTALAVAQDVYASNPENQLRPRTEVVVSVAIDDGEQVVFSRTDAYYIADADERLFKEKRRVKVYEVVGGK